MDRIYRHQRYIYDLTRRYYLFGRDTLLRQMHLRDGDRVLEVGCGTARNLLKLAALKPCHLYGLDASAEMLVTARANVTSAKLACRIALARCYAEDLTPANPFGLPCPFDAIFFSYSLSMIPTWPAALDAAMASVRPGGAIYIVDFYDQLGMPKWFRSLLRRWLALFHVEHRPELLTRLREIAADGRGTLHVQSLAGRYAYIARLTLPR
jgi:S-adenosylmethionine-diacylgycerolhomoserine-N-methlytransferase